MTDIVEQAARVINKAMAANIYKRFDPATGPTFGESIAQALADAGLLRDEVKVREGVCLECGGGVLNNGEHIDPSRHRDYVRARDSRTVPTREEIVEAVSDIDAESWPNPASTEEIADAVLELLADQPTVAEVQEQWANYITNTTGSVGNNLTLESLVKALRAPHPPFGGPHKNEDQK